VKREANNSSWLKIDNVPNFVKHQKPSVTLLLVSARNAHQAALVVKKHLLIRKVVDSSQELNVLLVKMDSLLVKTLLRRKSVKVVMLVVRPVIVAVVNVPSVNKDFILMTKPNVWPNVDLCYTMLMIIMVNSPVRNAVTTVLNVILTVALDVCLLSTLFLVNV
jgi:hypothetical protein